MGVLVLIAMTANVAAECNNNAHAAFDCDCIMDKDDCKSETKDVCEWKNDKCSEKPCNEIDDEDTCGDAEIRCKWNSEKKCKSIVVEGHRGEPADPTWSQVTSDNKFAVVT